MPQTDHRDPRRRAVCGEPESAARRACRRLLANLFRAWARLYGSACAHHFDIPAHTACRPVVHGPVIVCCEDGAALITCAGDPNDYLLVAGQERFFEHGNAIVATTANRHDARLIVHPLG